MKLYSNREISITPTFWVVCPCCGGQSSFEIARPQHDDPYFAVVEKCEACNGASYVEAEEPEQIEMEELL